MTLIPIGGRYHFDQIARNQNTASLMHERVQRCIGSPSHTKRWTFYTNEAAHFAAEARESLFQYIGDGCSEDEVNDKMTE